MGLKLGKGGAAERDDLAGTLRAARSELDDAVEAFNDRLSEARTALEEAIEAYNAAVGDAKAELQEALDGYNGALDEARAFADGVASAAEEAVEGKSERWQGSERGEAAKAYAEAWRELAEGLCDVELDLPEDLEVELPGDVACDADDHADMLDEAPDEAG